MDFHRLAGRTARALAGCVIVAVGAGSCSGGTFGAGSSCVAGETKTCPCSATAMGVQVCADDGSDYSACSCDDGGASSTDGASGDGTVVHDGSGSDGSSSIDATAMDGNSSDGSSSIDATAMDGSSSMDATGRDATTDGDAGDGAIADASGDTAPVDGCVPMGPEDCFDGIDDDCNGLTDCADPACQPVAECVPEAIGFTYGAEVAAGGACPAQFGAATLDLEQGLNESTTCTGCTCTASMTCTNVLTVGAPGACPPVTPVATFDISSAACTPISLTTHNAHIDTTTAHTSCGTMGTPSPTPLAWGAHTRLCSTSTVGAGCAAGNVCVAKATKHCVATSGVIACAAGYTAEGSGGPWYTGVTDTRSCGSTCGCTTSGGSCQQSTVVLDSAPDCGGGITTDLLAQNHDYCGQPATYQSATVNMPRPQMGGDWPTCSASYSAMTGSVTATGSETLCCR
jgi:hypothetical protein